MSDQAPRQFTSFRVFRVFGGLHSCFKDRVSACSALQKSSLSRDLHSVRIAHSIGDFAASVCSADCPVCCIADCQSAGRPQCPASAVWARASGLATRDTAGWQPALHWLRLRRAVLPRGKINSTKNTGKRTRTPSRVAAWFLCAVKRTQLSSLV